MMKYILIVIRNLLVAKQRIIKIPQFFIYRGYAKQIYKYDIN